MVEFVRLSQISMEQGYTREIYLKNLKRKIFQESTVRVTNKGKPLWMFPLAYKNVKKKKNK